MKLGSRRAGGTVRTAAQTGVVMLALAVSFGACGSGDRLHGDTDFPLVPGARIVAHNELPTVGPEFGTTLIVLGDRSTTAPELVREEQALVLRDGWKRHVERKHVGGGPLKPVNVYWADPPADSVSFGPLNGPRHRRASPSDRALARGTDGPSSHKIYVDMVPPEPQDG
jgi:hypothetical protein